MLMPIALRQGTIDLSSYTRENLEDESLRSLGSRVAISVDDNPDPNAFDPQTVRVTLRDGRTYSSTKDFSLGSPSQPMSPSQLHEKFRSNVDRAGRGDIADQMIDLVGRVAELDDANQILELL